MQGKAGLEQEKVDEKSFCEYQRPKLKPVWYRYEYPVCHKKGRNVIVHSSLPKPLLNHSLVLDPILAKVMC